MINLIKDQIEKTFFMEKSKNKNGWFNNIWIYPFKTQSGAIISIQPLGLVLCSNEQDLHGAIEHFDHRQLTSGIDMEKWHVQIKINDDVEYLESESREDVLNLFKKHGEIDVEGTIRLKKISMELNDEQVK